ncbi:MAG: winged helix-turn-helix transcriptional regulator [Thermoplasmatota archaeon]
MDPDFAVLCAIQRAPLDGPAAWARAAKQDVSSVRRRIKRLEETGVLQGFSAIPPPAVFGRTYAPYTFQSDEPPNLDAVLAVPDVAWAVSVLDGRTFVIAYEAGTHRQDELETILGPATDAFEHAGRPQAATLGRMDFKILRELIIDPRATVSNLCERTGLSAKTVRAHRAAMVARGEVKIDPIIRPPNTPGRLYYNLSVHGPKAPKVESPLAITLETFESPPATYLLATAKNLQEQMTFLRELELREDVSNVNVMMTHRFAMASARLVGWCNEKLEEWEKARIGSTG